MAKLIFKERLDTVIQLAKDYYQTSDRFLVEDLQVAEHECFGDDYWIDDIITGLTCKQKDKNTPNEIYYKVLECLGYKIVNEYEEDK